MMTEEDREKIVFGLSEIEDVDAAYASYVYALKKALYTGSLWDENMRETLDTLARLALKGATTDD